MMNMKCLRETFKTGTVEKVGKLNQSLAGELHAPRKQELPVRIYADIDFGRKVATSGKTKISNLEKGQSRTMGGSVTKEKNVSVKKHFQERESAPPKSVFELFQSGEHSGKGAFELILSEPR